MLKFVFGGKDEGRLRSQLQNCISMKCMDDKMMDEVNASSVIQNFSCLVLFHNLERSAYLLL